MNDDETMRERLHKEIERTKQTEARIAERTSQSFEHWLSENNDVEVVLWFMQFAELDALNPKHIALAMKTIQDMKETCRISSLQILHGIPPPDDENTKTTEFDIDGKKVILTLRKKCKHP